MTDIVETLRRFDAWEKVIRRHKLVHKAADEIERLRERLHYCNGVADNGWAEIERLRAALQKIADMNADDDGYHAVQAAKEALDEAYADAMIEDSDD